MVRSWGRSGRIGGHQGAAGPREHQYHPDLHQRGAGADGEGGGEVVRGESGLQGKKQDLISAGGDPWGCL